MMLGIKEYKMGDQGPKGIMKEPRRVCEQQMQYLSCHESLHHYSVTGKLCIFRN